MAMRLWNVYYVLPHKKPYHWSQLTKGPKNIIAQIIKLK